MTELEAAPTNGAAPHGNEPGSDEVEAIVIRAWFDDDKFARAWKPNPELFRSPRCYHVATACMFLDPERRDEAALVAQLDRAGALAKAGGVEGVFKLLRMPPPTSDPWAQVQRLRELAAVRALRVGMQDALETLSRERALSGAVARVTDALAQANAQLEARVLSERDLMQLVIAHLASKTPLRLGSTGIAPLDRLTGGLRAAHVWVLAADTNFGKSGLMIMFADESLGIGARVLLVSAEDAPEIYARRIAARRARVNALRLRDRSLNAEEHARVAAVAEAARPIPFFLNAIGKSVESVTTEMRSIVACEQINVVLVDYLQAMRAEKSQQDRRNEVTYVSRLLTDVIKNAGVTGVLASQLRRPAGSGRPTKHDLKESGDVENQAEVVLLGYRDSEKRAKLFVDKAKDGPVGDEYDLSWDPNAACWNAIRDSGDGFDDDFERA